MALLDDVRGLVSGEVEAWWPVKRNAITDRIPARADGLGRHSGLVSHEGFDVTEVVLAE